MRAKNLLVPFVAIAAVLFLLQAVSAMTVTGDLTQGDPSISVNGIDVTGNDVSVIAGDTISVRVRFVSDVDASDVKIKAEIEGDKIDSEVTSASFDVEEGMTYRQVLTLKVPSELKDVKSDYITLNLKIWNGDFKTEAEDIQLRVQRPSYNAVIKSVTAPQTVDAGDTIPVELVLKNVGYNDLDDLYVSIKIPALNIEKTGYFGDLVAIEDCTDSCDDEDTDTISGRLTLEVPYNAKAGVYSLEVSVKNDDTTSSQTKQITINNVFSGGNVMVTATSKTVAVGENAEYSLVILNPTDKLKVYRIVTESSSGLSSNAGEAVVAVPAGSSKTVKVTANADKAGEYKFNVNVFSGEELVQTIALNAKVEGSAIGGTNITSPIVVLTIILAIVFLVLLVVLIVLLGKKPEKSEEFGESYY